MQALQMVCGRVWGRGAPQSCLAEAIVADEERAGHKKRVPPPGPAQIWSLLQALQMVWRG